MNYLLLFTALVFSVTNLSAKRIFVTTNGTAAASGISWNDATDLHSATQRATANDEIWVQTGTYLTSTNGDRSASFRIMAGVSLYGGFVGTESSLNERPAASRSLLSGEIGNTASIDDNAWTILTLLADTDAVTYVDGFTITAGNAFKDSRSLNAANAGGGIFMHKGNGFLTAHEISNCTFKNNKGMNGAAVFVATGNPLFENCFFANNAADFKGGAVYNQGAGSQANARFVDCRFESNSAKHGGAIANNGENGVSNPLLINCQFISNVARNNGSAVYNMSNDMGHCAVITEQCFFGGNICTLGEVIGSRGETKSVQQRRSQSDNTDVIISGSVKR